MPKIIRFFIATCLASMLPFSTALPRPVIPGAVGFGTDTPAGRGGEIIRVSNLNDEGPGSLRACVEASGPRVCAFEVSGTISLADNLTVHDPYLTIAGQTAPAPGIMLRGASLIIRASDVLVQHIAVRAGDDLDGPRLYSRDSVKILGTKGPVENVVLDHCSLSWAIDEVVEVWGDWNDVTLSNNIISEPLRNTPESAGKDQGYGVLVDATPGRISFFGNLFAHVHNRTPRSAASDFVFVNNVVYNAGIIQLNLFNADGVTSSNSIVGNVFRRGADTTAKMPVKLGGELTTIITGSEIYLADNDADVGTSDPWSIVMNASDTDLSLLRASEAPVWIPDLEVLDTGGGAVLDHVLANAGSRPAERSGVDSRVIQDVEQGTGRIINCVSDDGSSRCGKNAGGWPDLEKNVRHLSVPADPDGDDDGDGYTNLEEWLQDMAAKVEGGTDGLQMDARNDRSPPKPPKLR